MRDDVGDIVLEEHRRSLVANRPFDVERVARLLGVEPESVLARLDELRRNRELLRARLDARPDPARQLARLAGVMGTRRSANALVGAIGVVGVALLGSSSR